MDTRGAGIEGRRALLILVRHPAVDLPPGICYGRKEVDIACVADIDEILGKIPMQGRLQIWSSPSIRCARVAATLAEHRDSESRYDDRLRELDFGAWEGVAWSDIPRAALDAWASDPLGFTPPLGESGGQLIARVQSFYTEIIAHSSAQIVISHGGPLRILSALALGVPINLLAPSPPLGSVQLLERATVPLSMFR